jgi:DNA polymerase III subunit gamma/tau
MFVYRDDSSTEDYLAAAAAAQQEALQREAAQREAAAREAAEREAAYWYGPAEPTGPDLAGETRGPFEPLVNVAGQAPEPAKPLEPAEPDEPEDPLHRHAQKLEQIKDLYLTAQAIGEENVDKHFDQLLAQQRELISEYFKQSGAKRTDADRAAAASREPDEPTEPATPSQAGATPADAAW